MNECYIDRMLHKSISKYLPREIMSITDVGVDKLQPNTGSAVLNSQRPVWEDFCNPDQNWAE